MPLVIRWRAAASAGLIAVATVTGSGSLPAQVATPDARPYDERLQRLAEILGSVHFLRELCGNTDGQMWRDRMRELMDAEGSSAARRARMTRSFNNGYRSYSRTYKTCTPSAQTAITRFLAEGADIAERLARNTP